MEEVNHTNKELRKIKRELFWKRLKGEFLPRLRLVWKVLIGKSIAAVTEDSSLVAVSLYDDIELARFFSKELSLHIDITKFVIGEAGISLDTALAAVEVYEDSDIKKVQLKTAYERYGG